MLLNGKSVSFADLKDIVQDSLEATTNVDLGKKFFRVKDFQVTTSQNNKAVASVEVSLEDKILSGKAEGVGPVDAVISAFRKASQDKVNFSLADFKVSIRGAGTNSVVYVEIKLTNNGTVSLGSGTSPDIIQASVAAFEEAFNGLI